MTEYIELGKPDVSELRVGDLVTLRNKHKNAKPCEAEVWAEGDGETLHAGLTQMRFWNGIATPSYIGSVTSVRRPVQELPTKPYALVVPYDIGDYWAYSLLEDGGEWVMIGDSGLSQAPNVAEALAAGTHYVAFEGVEVGR